MRHLKVTRATHRPALVEGLEQRQFLSAALAVSSSLMVFNAIQNATSQVETLTLTNTGDAALSLTGASIVADPTETDGSAHFALVNSLPSTLAVGGSFALQVDYTASLVGIEYALLDIASSAPSTPIATVGLHGIGTTGNGGPHQPSLMRILHAYDMPNYNRVGETDETSAYYPEPPASNTTEVNLQQMVKAGPGDVTFTVLASFVGDAPTPMHIGWYEPSNVSGTKQELFHTVESDYQSVYVQPVGDTSFDPGSAVFGLFNPSQTVSVNGSLVTWYTQDSLNPGDPTDPRKFRFFPLENADGAVVPNSYIMTATEWPAPVGYDFTNIVAIITNVKEAAPVATPDTATATAGTPTTVDVLSNDAATTGTLTDSSVTITTAPASGGTATVDPTTGTVTYTAPANFHGTDTFSYTVANTAGYTSAPVTVTMTVNAGVGGIVTSPLTATATAGVAQTVNVLAVDTDSTGNLLPSTVTITTAPSNGGTATVNTDGTIAYTPAATFAGTETFAYTVGDTAGAVSNPTTVTVTVASPAAAPVATGVTTSTTDGTAKTIDIVSTTTTTVGLNLASLAIATQPVHGTATVGSDGTITYTPAAGFVGADSLAYTVADTNGHKSNLATVPLNVGVTVGTGADRSLTLPQGSTVSLTRGSATVFFTGTGAVTLDKAGRAIVAGSDLAVSTIALSNTTAASALSITGRSAVTLTGLTDAAVLGKLVAPSTTLTGTITLAGLNALQVAGLTNAALTIGSGTAGVSTLTLGTVSNSTLSSAVPLKTLKATGWTTAGTASITAPSIATLAVTGNFEPNMTLTSTATALNAVTIGGNLGSAVAWSIAGSVRALTVGSVAAGDQLSIAGYLSTLLVRGDLAGTLTAATAKSIRVTGNVADATLSLTAAGTAFGAMTVSGSITGSTITTAGNAGSITAALLSDDTVLIGASPGTTFGSATTATLGTATLTSLRLTTRATTAFANTSVVAHTINTATLGTVATDNGGTPDGLALATARSITGTANGKPFRVTKATATQVFGDFEVKLPTA